MKRAYLEVTYRKGRAIAAYYYLPRRGDDKSVRTERVDGGLLVDFYPTEGPSESRSPRPHTSACRL